MNQFTDGDSLFIDEEYNLAIQQYTAAIEIVKQTESFSASLYAHRAAAYLKLKKYTNALQVT
jgi:hypothetical protein